MGGEKINIQRLSAGSWAVILISFALWFFFLRRSLSYPFLLSGDGAVYYEHIKFYLDYIRHGVYPLWDPNREWGVPVEFYLRRIGEFNPLYYLIIFFDIIGFSYTSAYIIFLGSYFWLGVMGFFLIARNIFRDEKTALLAYLLLLFSSLGMKLFDSYIILMFTPMVWFFYFLIMFSQRQEKKFFLGIIFTLMITAITYLPFYFLIIFILFLLCYAVLYPAGSKKFIVDLLRFISKNRSFAVICAFLLAMSLIPGIMLFSEGGRGEIVLPQRSAASPDHNAFTINIQRSYEGGIVVLNVLSELIYNLKEFQLGVFYLPAMAFILVSLAVWTSINRRMIFFILWGGFLFLLSLGEATMVYQFLYKNIFFMKFFRNLQYFLWILILPAFILIVVGQFQQFWRSVPSSIKAGALQFAWLSAVHGGLLIFLLFQDGIIISTYLTLGLSWLLFSGHYLARLFSKKYSAKGDTIFFYALFLLILVQPSEVYNYLHKNLEVPEKGFFYCCDRSYMNLHLPKKSQSPEKLPPGRLTVLQERQPVVWMDLQWSNFLRSNLHPVLLDKYLYSKLVVYDNVEVVDENNLDLKMIGEAFLNDENRAFIFSSDTTSVSAGGASAPYAVVQDSFDVQVLDFGANFLKLGTDFNTSKFLVYNDSYHKSWKVYINGRQEKLLQANVAFKGVWLPAGKNIVYFKYAGLFTYLLKYLLIFLFAFTFVWLVGIFIRPVFLRSDR